MRVAVTGATGTIGRALVQALRAREDEVAALVRDELRAREALGGGVALHTWAEPTAAPAPDDALAGAEIVVNLMGEPIAQRWTDQVKSRIRDSRVIGTQRLVEAIDMLPEEQRPGVLISQSASGYYGARGDEQLDEEAPPGSDFLARVVVDWEQAALRAGVPRVVVTRTGVVLSPTGGALDRMLPFFRLGIGGPVAGGRQYVPWVHLDDVVGAILYCAGDPDVAGAVNVTAPHPVTNAELSRALGHVLRRPAMLPVPELALRLLYGEMAQVVSSGQRVVPARLERSGYTFRHTDVEAALRDALKQR